jgi:hypothetical protein
MFIEEIEENDWNIKPNDNNDYRKYKSIESYHLHNWYDKLNEITFNTYIYESIDDIPEVLPFKKCMIRYENKSPKDSEFWGPVEKKEELINVFYTSLRCKTNKGKYICIREWIDLQQNEYRCFWNNGLVAVSSESDNEPPIEKILTYINSIKNKIFYNRCVFDIGELLDRFELCFIEFNSWETNSGGHRFDWINDTEILYQSNNIQNITFRWKNGENIISDNLIKKHNIDIKTDINTNTNTNFDINMYEIIKPSEPSNYLVTDKYIYLTNDIWLGRYDLKLNSINWKRGQFRFGYLQICNDGCIFDGTNYYYYDLTPKKTRSQIIKVYNSETMPNVNNGETMPNVNNGETMLNVNNGETMLNVNNGETIANNTKTKYKYAIKLKHKVTGEIHYLRMLDNCELVLCK